MNTHCIDPNRRPKMLCMAHFEGTGPAGTFCRECKNFRKKGSFCAKWVQMMNHKGKKPQIPGTTKSCKYFEESPVRT